MKQPIFSQYREGFTIVEAVVTIVVGGIFLFSFIMLYTTVTQSFIRTRNQATANDIAYSRLRKYVSAGATPTWFICDSSSGSSNTNDLVINHNATGQVLESGTLTTEESGLPAPVTFSVTALAIYGCNGVNLKKPIRVESIVTYGQNNSMMRHASIVEY